MRKDQVALIENDKRFFSVSRVLFPIVVVVVTETVFGSVIVQPYSHFTAQQDLVVHQATPAWIWPTKLLVSQQLLQFS